jgi:hypothetical protein
MGYQDSEPLPALAPQPSRPEDIDYNKILEIANLNGVDQALDQLVAGGMSPQQAGEMLQRSGFDLPAQAEEYPENLPQGAEPPPASEPEVRRAAPASTKSSGSRMDLSFIQRLNDPNLSEEQARAEYQKLPPALRYVYDRTADFSYSNQGSETPAQLDPRDAAGWLDEFYKTQQQAQDPAKQAQVSERNAKVVERQAVQNDFKIRRQNTIKNIEEILGDKDYSSLVGPIDGTIGSVYDAAFNEKMQAKRAKLDRLINIDVLDMTKYLRPISQDELKYLRTLVPGQRQNWEVYKQYLGEKLDMLKATDRAVVNPATNQPLPNDEGQSAPQPQQNVYQQSQQNPASQLRSQFESSDTLKLPDGRVLKKITKQDGSIGWSE